MSNANDVVKDLTERYVSAVNANDTSIYRTLFANDAIRIPPGCEPEHGPDQISASEQKDYDVARWSIEMWPVDALQIADDWVYGIARVDATVAPYAGGETKQIHATKTFLLERQPSGAWLIKRYQWNLL